LRLRFSSFVIGDFETGSDAAEGEAVAGVGEGNIEALRDILGSVAAFSVEIAGGAIDEALDDDEDADSEVFRVCTWVV
jgi:hypothetical protein